MMFNLFVKFKWRKCVIVATRLNIHSCTCNPNTFSKQQLKEYEDLIQEFCIDTISATRILKHKKLLKIPLEQLKANYTMCRKYDIKLSDTLSTFEILRMKPLSLENRILLLQEFGATNANDVALTGLRELMKMEVEPFKKFVGIPAEVDVVQRFFETVYPKSYDPSLQENLSKNLTILELRTQLLPQYVMWRFNIPESVLQAKPSFWKPFLFRSLKMVNDSVEYVMNTLGWEFQKVQGYHYVTRYELNNIKRINEEIKGIGDLSIKEFIYQYPRILSSQVDNIKGVLAYLRQIEVPEASILNCRRVLTLHPDIVIEKMNSILSNPVFTVFRNHPRFLYLILVRYQLQERVEFLHSINFTCMSLNALMLPQSRLEKMCANGLCLSNSFDVEAYLNHEFPNQSAALIKEIKKNPNWLHVPLQKISESLQYLKQYFSLDDISKNIHLILYLKSDLEKTWKFVQTQYENYEGRQFTSTQKLALCLYHLELKHHFTGDGILISQTTKDEQIHSGDEPKLKNQDSIEDKVERT